MENLEDLRELLEGSKDLARVQNLIDLYGKCETGFLFTDRELSNEGKKRFKFTALVEQALIESLELKGTGLSE